MEMRLMLPCLRAVVLKHVHSDYTKRLSGSMSNFSYKRVHALDFGALDVENRFAMFSGNHQHGTALILPLIDFRNRMFVLGNECTFPRARQIVAEAAVGILG